MKFFRNRKSKKKTRLPKHRSAKLSARERIAEHFQEEEEEETLLNPGSSRDLENLLLNEGIVNYDPACIRKKSNWTHSESQFLFDHPTFSPEQLLNAIPSHSPKLAALLSKIDELDQADMRQHGHMFKHFVFSDLKSSSSGAKLLASALIARGFRLGYSAEPKGEDAKSMYHKIEALTDAQLSRGPPNHFFLLSSKTVYDQPISVGLKKQLLLTYNKRPENVHGELARIIVMDSGFKEGIDLFDVKYVHLFEPSTIGSDQKQVIGRATRTCGQKGLAFHPTLGWPLSVFVYDMTLPAVLQPMFLNAGTGIDLYLKSKQIDLKQLHFASQLEETTIFGAVDYELNRTIHAFQRAEARQQRAENRQLGGAQLRVRKDIPILRVDPQRTRNGFMAMRDWVREHYGQFSWENVQMENLCLDAPSAADAATAIAVPPAPSAAKAMKDPNAEICPRRILAYTPSQQFVRHFFTPVSPLKGMLLWWSVGTGKTCAAISTATSHFERDGYTILWVTRTTLKNDIWKNMFDQVCNEDIRYRLENDPNFAVPATQDKRMRLLSKSWRIRPMSYKQFSNLVSKQNAFYKTLVKINGEQDPLRKTLIVIDEAHKLYGGDDLSSIERPDMPAFEQSIQQSYAVSGPDSVRLLLMTATPITQNPLEVVQLLNLCKPVAEQLPTTYETFTEPFLDQDGSFTEAGKTRYLDAISGHISYLNREKDARQFAQPTVFPVHVPIVEDLATAKRFDRKLVREFMESNRAELESKIEAKNKQIEDELGDINEGRFRFLKEEICGDIENTPKRDCEKVVNQNIKLLVAELKREADSIRREIREMRESIKAENKARYEELQKIGKNREDFVEEYAEYKKTPLYALKEDCALHVDTMSELAKNIHQHPRIADYDRRIGEHRTQLENWKAGMKERLRTYQARMKQLKQMLKGDLSDLESQVIKATIRDEQKRRAEVQKTTEKTIQDGIQELENKRKKKIAGIRKTVKKMIQRKKEEERQQKREEKELRKTMRQQEGVREEFEEGKVKNAVDKYTARMFQELVEMDEERFAKEEEKRRQKEEKENRKKEEKRIKMLEKEMNRKTMKKKGENKGRE